MMLIVKIGSCRNFYKMLIQLTFAVTLLFYDIEDPTEYIQIYSSLASFVDIEQI